MGDKNVKAFSTLAGGFCNSLFLLKEKNIHQLNVMTAFALSCYNKGNSEQNLT